MEWFNALWISTILPLLSTYGITFLMMLGVIIATALFTVVIYLVPSISKYIKALAEKSLSEKVSMRIKDALNKFEVVVIEMLECQRAELQTLAKKAMENDGIIDSAEVQAIAKRLAAIAVERITPDIDTFKKYISGNALMDYIEQKISAIVNQTVNGILEKQFGKK